MVEVNQADFARILIELKANGIINCETFHDFDSFGPPRSKPKKVSVDEQKADHEEMKEYLSKKFDETNKLVKKSGKKNLVIRIITTIISFLVGILSVMLSAFF